MKDDPIVEEIHQVRQRMLAECHGSLDQWLRPIAGGRSTQTAIVSSCWRRYANDSDAHKAAI